MYLQIIQEIKKTKTNESQKDKHFLLNITNNLIII